MGFLYQYYILQVKKKRCQDLVIQYNSFGSLNILSLSFFSSCFPTLPKIIDDIKKHSLMCTLKDNERTYLDWVDVNGAC